ncbi:SDR family NAD(P)-dependent oxidoreductase [Sorangium sp. So ce315]|uniref:SDR family NAD(P)-dependent oxidoreductase n=1 Tax=Sorangium sp. So ce315 TaxID=3133299 RepID=UPI003F607B93
MTTINGTSASHGARFIGERAERTLHRLMSGVLCAQLRSLGLFAAPSLESWKERIALPRPLDRWIEESLRALQEDGVVAAAEGCWTVADPALADGADVWARWEAHTREALSDPRVRLLDVTLRALPEILTGRQRATDVLFPGGSMQLVEGVYGGDRAADAFNATVADVVAAIVNARLRVEPGARVRILEIGAGTGGTSEGVLARLEPCVGAVEEYCFTDVSRVFLARAQEHYAQRHPCLKTAIFDVEQPLADQGIAAGRYDVVIAANVLHATKNVRVSLRNAKAALQGNGVLVLNELSGRSLFAHLTFGLLDRWWNYDDQALRLSGTPALTFDGWQRALRAEGFHSITCVAQGEGQQIIAAQSDGVIRQPSRRTRWAAATGAPETASRGGEGAPRPVRTGGIAVPPSRGEAAGEDAVRAHIERTLLDELSATLRMDRGALDAARSFADYGLDSIMSVRTTEGINKALAINLTSTSMFDHPSIRKLAAHIFTEYRGLVTAQLARPPGDPERASAMNGAPNATAAAELASEATARPAERSAGGEEKALRDHVRRTLLEQLSFTLKMDRDAIDPGRSFADYGLDSIMGVRTTEAVNAALSIELTSTSVFDHPTIDKLAAHIVTTFGDVLAAERAAAPSRGGAVSEAQLLPPSRSGAAPEAQPLPPTRAAASPPAPFSPLPTAARPASSAGTSAASSGREPIAIIGMSARFARADSVQELWKHLAEGVDLTEPVTRWDLAREYAAANIENGCQRGGFLGDIDAFEPLFFNISGVEATYMDPQQRLFLQESWRALEDAGYAGPSIEGRRCGVYVGFNAGDYPQLFAGLPPCPDAMLGSASSILSARIAYFLDLKGPAMTIDAACSSSMVTMHLACQALRGGEIDMALAGGVYVQCTPSFYVLASVTGMLSPRGRCHTFDDRADGFVPGEGVGAVVLKRLSDAITDGDHVYAVIRGSAINQDGTTNGITAPSALSQERLEREVYETFGIHPEEIEMVEAHGTGTKLGDPIEFQALTRAFRKFTAKKHFCAIGSIKTNIGHTTAAAGLAGVIKCVLALQHRRIPPSLHFERGNSHIDFEDSPFYVNTTLRPWEAPPGRRRCAAVSSFGMSGTNAHMVLEQAPPIPRTHRELPAHLVVLSARTAEQLREQAERLLRHCEESPTLDGGSVSYTLLVGRKHFEHRLACVARDTSDIASVLREWLGASSAGGRRSIRIREGRVARDFVEQPMLREVADGLFGKLTTLEQDSERYQQAVAALGDLYCQGYSLDWRALYGAHPPRRVPLPGYPFAKERYWVAAPRAAAPAVDREAGRPHGVESRGGVQPHDDGPRPARQTSAPLGGVEREEGVERLLFSEEWQPSPLERSAASTAAPCSLVVISRDRQHGEGLLAALRARDPGVHGEVVELPASADDAGAASTLAESFRRVVNRRGRIDAVWCSWALEPTGRLDDHAPIVRVIQGLASARVGEATVLLAAECASPVERCHGESWIGYERSLKHVLPHVRLAVIHEQKYVDGANDAAQADARDPLTRWAHRLWDELHGEKIESALYVGQRRHVLRVKPIEDAPMEEPPLRAGGAYLITGGLGGLGYLFARHLAERYAAHLILVGRSPLDAAKEERIQALRALGGEAIYIAADVADRDQLRAALDEGQERFGRLRGVIHAAGVATGEDVLGKDFRSFEEVLAAKVAGTLALHDVCGALSLDFLCHFSSVSAVLGDVGSCDYAVGNRFELAHAKYVSGRAVALCWPLWADGGMRFGDGEATQLYLKSSGQEALRAADGVEVFEQVLARYWGGGPNHAVVLSGRKSRVHRMLGLTPPAGESERPEPAAPRPDQRRPELVGLTLEDCVLWDVREISSEMLAVPRERLDAGVNLTEFGFDSIRLADFATRLSRKYGVEITPAVFFSHNNLSKLAEHLVSAHGEALRAVYGGGETNRPAAPSPAIDARAHGSPQPAPVASRAPRSRPALLGLSLEECALWELRDLLSAAVDLPREKLDTHGNLAEFGLDSIKLAEFAKRLSQYYALDITPAVFFSQSSLAKLSEHLVGTYGEHLRRFYGVSGDDRAGTPAPATTVVPGVAPEHAPPPSPAAARATDGPEPIAIVGMSGRFPGARTVEELWDILASGREAIEEIPLERFDWRAIYEPGNGSPVPKKTNSKWMGVMPGADEFDPLFFEISPREALSMDPRQRLLLQEAYRALEDAGYAAAQLDRDTIGVFVGVEQGDYQDLLSDDGVEGTIASSHEGILAARLSYFLNLRGPVLALNTACSSGLVAAHQACMSLRARECDAAIAAGVNLVATPYNYVGMSQAGMLSPDGKCYAFDRRANGIVAGEAVVAVVLKRLSQARADGDLIYAVIRGSGINYDGKTNGITAPSGTAQTELIEGVHRRAGIDPAAIEYIVTHGTGTRLGDPVEINALADAFKRVRHDEAFCALTSAKTNVGHTFAAAGLVNLVSLVQALRHEMIPASLHCEQLSDYIDWSRSPFFVNTRNKAWRKRPDRPRLGAVSAFGLSGTNAHMVVEGDDAPEALASPSQAAPYFLLALSAKTEEALLQRTRDLVDLLKKGTSAWDAPSLASLSYTLLNHRQRFHHRCAVVIADRAQAIAVLERASSGESHAALLRGKVAKEFVEQPALKRYVQNLLTALPAQGGDPQAYRESLTALADVYCQGYQLDWQKLYGDVRPTRVRVPTYPFARKRYWIQPVPRTPAAAAATELATSSDRSDSPRAGSPLVGLRRLVRVWEPVEVPEGALPRAFAGEGEGTLVIGGDEVAREAIRARHPRAVFSDIAPDDHPSAIAHRLKRVQAIEHVLWIAPRAPMTEPDALVDAQERGVLHGFRIMKALLASGHEASALAWTIVTTRTQAVHRTDEVEPSHAGIHGLIGAMAKEYPGWSIRLLDFESDADWRTSRWFEVPPDHRARCWARRGGQWHQAQLVDAQPVEAAASGAYRRGGVYVVIGGAGYVGAAWSEWVVRRYQAKVIWLGRREKDAAIRAKIDRVANFGPAPEYISADATDRESLERAHAQIQRSHPQIDGLVLSSARLQPRLLTEMDERQFTEELRAKVDASVRALQVFGDGRLPLVLFFSSLISFVRNPRQSAYAAGCTFADAFAHALSRRAEPVAAAIKVMNWGYWDNPANDGLDEFAQMKRMGIGAITVEEAMPALDSLIAGPLDQMGFIKLTKPLVIEGMDRKSVLTVHRERPATNMERMKARMTQPRSV